MAVWLESTPPRKATCEICGASDETRYLHHHDKLGYQVKTRANRARVPKDWWPVFQARLAGYEHWAGRLVCGQCYEDISSAINA